jgi:uncharacterized protein YecT (DUF1311 family)
MAKTLLFLLAGVLCANSLPAQQPDSTAAIPACRYAEMTSPRICLRARLAAADSELAETVRTARERAQGKEVFDSAQVAWLRFRDADCRASADVYRGGSLASVVALSCRLGQTRRRIADLRGDYFSDGPDPGRREP